MNTLRDHERDRTASGSGEGENRGEFSRRTVLAGAAATTAIAAVGSSDMVAYARTANPNSKEDMLDFLALSVALTGVSVVNLAPEFTPAPTAKTEFFKADPGVDPINVKNDYFNWINVNDPVTFEKMLQIVKDNRSATNLPQLIIEKVNASDDTKYLARSIVLLWYLGSWYNPEDLKSASPSGELLKADVVSAKAYTQGKVWQIAQTHPMGYSNMQFGYWAREPVDPNDKNSPLGFVTTTLL